MTDTTAPHLSIFNLLSMMEREGVQSIQLNHMVIEPNADNITLTRRATWPVSFLVTYHGHVDVEFTLDHTQRHVAYVSLRQSAMTFSELDANGEVLPSMTIATTAIPADERVRLDALAQRFMEMGRISDKERAESLMAQYANRVVFAPSKYGGIRHV